MAKYMSARKGARLEVSLRVYKYFHLARRGCGNCSPYTGTIFGKNYLWCFAIGKRYGYVGIFELAAANYFARVQHR